MPPSKYNSNRQNYPRGTHSLLAAQSLFPIPEPLSDRIVISAIKSAFERTLKNRRGELRHFPATPTELVELCIKHLKERTDPILGAYFYSLCDVQEVFDLDAISHEMQRQRMNIGIYYQYLIIELMRAASKHIKRPHIEAVFDGTHEGDVVADVRTPGFSPGLRVYGSVKKSSDTVGGQDIPGVIRRLEGVAKAERNITRPYICVFCYATPSRGMLRGYQESRSIKFSQSGYPYSENCESWEPGFIYPYISGRSAVDIYKISISKVRNYLPFHTLKYRNECAHLLTKRFGEMGLLNNKGKLDQERLLAFVAQSNKKRLKK